MPENKLNVMGVIKLLQVSMANKMADLLASMFDMREDIALWAIDATVTEDIKKTVAKVTLPIDNLLTDELNQYESLKAQIFRFLSTILTENRSRLEQLLEEELPELIRSIGQKQRPLKVGIIGGTKVGKTTLINYIADKPVAEVGAGGQSTTIQDEPIDIDIHIEGQPIPSRVTLIDTMGFCDTRVTEDTQAVSEISSEAIGRCKRFDVVVIVLGAENGNNIDIRTCQAVRKYAKKVIFIRNKIDAADRLEVIEKYEDWEIKFNEFKEFQDREYKKIYEMKENEEIEVYYTYCVRGACRRGDEKTYMQAKDRRLTLKKQRNYGDDDINAIRRRLYHLDREMQKTIIREGLQGIVERMLEILTPHISECICRHLTNQVSNRFTASDQPGCPEESCVGLIIQHSLSQDSGREYLRRITEVFLREGDESEIITNIRNTMLLDMVVRIQNILFNQFSLYRENKGMYPKKNFETMGLLMHAIYTLTADSIPKQISITVQKRYSVFGDAICNTKLLHKSIRKKLYNKYWKEDCDIELFSGTIVDEETRVLSVIDQMADNAHTIKARIERLMSKSSNVETIAVVSFYTQMYVDSMNCFIQSKDNFDVVINTSKDLFFLSDQLLKFIPCADAPDILNEPISRELLTRTLNYFRGSRHTRDSISNFFKKIPLWHLLIDFIVLEKEDGQDGIDIREFINSSNVGFTSYQKAHIDAANRKEGELKNAMISIIHINIYDFIRYLKDMEPNTILSACIDRFNEKVRELLQSQGEEVRRGLKDYINRLLGRYIEDLVSNGSEGIFNRYKPEIIEKFRLSISEETAGLGFSVEKHKEEKGLLEGNAINTIVAESDVLMLTMSQLLYDRIGLTAIQNMSNNIPIQPSPAGSTFNSARGQAEEVISLPHFIGPFIPQTHEDAFKKLAVMRSCSEQYLKGIGITDIEKVNMRCCSGKSLLHIATELDRKEVAAMLIAMGHDISQRDSLGMSAIHTAAQVGSCSIIRLLHEKGANVNEICNGITPLMSAANQKQHLAAGVLIELGALVNDTDERGMTALHMAAEQNDEATVRAILRGKPKVNMTTLPYGSKDSFKLVTPIMVAVTKEDGANVVSALLESGADISTIKNQQNETAFIMALKKGSVPVIKAIFDGNIPIFSDIYGRNKTYIKKKIKSHLCERNLNEQLIKELMYDLNEHINRSKQIACSIAKMFFKLEDIILREDEQSPNTHQYNELIRRDIDHWLEAINVNLRNKQFYPDFGYI